MKKLKFASLFLAFTLLTIPVSRAEVIEPKLCARLKTERVYQRLKTDLEKDIVLALHSATPDLEGRLIELFGTYCLIVAAHIHYAPISTCSAWVPMVPRARIPKGISKTFALQQRVHAKFPEIIPRTPIVSWGYAGAHYVCSPDVVYDQLPKAYREKSLARLKALSNPSATPTRRVENRMYKTW